ncbi:DUF1097 domain-containing protein [Celeribacter baekdonensis]|uniref:DUF1097 domain-containing protein n=1 Tax=Celeribacter baekdonensis TaxID=875171 RepID=A0A2R4M0V0_9RHOB|nr:DUF1097 domain-containing protein [Celeribacter baekdonensis]AVW90786.1 DUF1097 domain-containing protein [Celeribacter baekdonensis]|tara:strand:+ start:39650 stop:40162 length:513 start_codon:yes stop_codon:yes gene_type:complete|eukprot:TRINITY_DN40752_c0_g1_i1.p1 TRINITY_DN40752_c0_g1~~TRINITY_DN40752_c0_g1_i1.p1  ORF type:complete len:171 (+),score=12.18 TRINITY_DN40752_c0_g1_i1:463-975(+)
MNLINALAISIGVLASVATYLCLGTGLGLQVWALFIGWGAYYHTGGTASSIGKCAINHAWGAVVATAALFVVATVGGSVAVTSIIVGLSVVVLVLGAHLPALATIPAAVYGYAATAGFALLSGVAIGDLAASAQATVMVLVSMIIGTLFGFVSEKGAGLLTAKSGATEAA